MDEVENIASEQEAADEKVYVACVDHEENDKSKVAVQSNVKYLNLHLYSRSSCILQTFFIYGGPAGACI